MNEPIKVNQEWEAPLMAGRILRRIRILAPHPDGDWIYEELPLIRRQEIECPIRLIQEFQIHKVFRLETDVCEHKYSNEIDTLGKGFSTHFRCTTCGDEFPIVGDTNFWFPKALKESE